MDNLDNKVAMMRECLHPHGTAPIVRLFLRDSAYFEKAFVDNCIGDLEKALIAAQALEEPLTPLQVLACHVLMDSSHMRFDKKEQG